VGIEALSRGASAVTFLDQNSKPITTIKNNLKLTRLEKNAQVFQTDTFQYLTRPTGTHLTTFTSHHLHQIAGIQQFQHGLQHTDMGSMPVITI